MERDLMTSSLLGDAEKSDYAKGTGTRMAKLRHISLAVGRSCAFGRRQRFIMSDTSCGHSSGTTTCIPQAFVYPKFAV
jgi:hypothetical protein